MVPRSAELHSHLSIYCIIFIHIIYRYMYSKLVHRRLLLVPHRRKHLGTSQFLQSSTDRYQSLTERRGHALKASAIQISTHNHLNPQPDMFVIHFGGNDLVIASQAKVYRVIRRDFWYLASVFVKVRIVGHIYFLTSWIQKHLGCLNLKFWRSSTY